MNNLLLFFFIIFTSLLLTELVRRYSIKKNILDTPNERSSHSVATPRGGGLAIVVVFLVTIILSNSLSSNTLWALTGAGLLVSVIGFWDDQGHVAAKWRLLSHFIAAFWVLFWLGDISEFQFLGLSIDLGWAGFVLVAFTLVWLLNLFNFMDGIDGIAASETIFISLAGAYFSWLNGFDEISFISLMLAASTFGFLVLNWHPAKIFMGDVGSGFLGLILGIIAYISVLEGGSIWIWGILWAIFLVDSGITLVRRIISGDKFYEAHCSHAYQHTARKWGHRNVTLATILINICWLLPLAYLVYLNPSMSAYLTLTAYVPLIILALKFKAGLADNQSKS